MSDTTPINPGPPRPPWRTIYFRLDAPHAEQVSVVGDFNNWESQKHPLRKDANGVWVCQMPLPAGQYAYSFVVDGVWQPDPQCSRRVCTATGEVRCILEVSTPPEA
jgi:1,4-alpha-glucan branching enzyme